jgi:hypothetical protein
MPLATGMCAACKHFGDEVWDEVRMEYTQVCTAFPKGIPDEIWVFGYDHRRPFGTESTLFELKDDDEFSVLSLETYEASQQALRDQSLGQ